MRILIAGASGFIGTELVHGLAANHALTLVGREVAKLQKSFPPNITLSTWENLTQLDAKNYDAVINLSGHNIAASRWNPMVKAKIIQSRVDTNHQLINWLNNQQAKPHYICANAVGIYGLQHNGAPEVFDENSPINIDCPPDFLSEVGIRWQESLNAAVEQEIPVTTIRLGVVLKRGQGFLKKLAPSFQMGMGSVVGDGKQIISWVHIDDVIAAILFLLQRPDLTGALNVTSPNPVSQTQFAKIFSAILHRPLLLKIPATIIHLLFGEMGDCLLLRGQRVIPKRLIDEGYTFLYSQCADALKQEFP
jgi:uncharacterized protein (TIGR01777 family)